MLNLTVVDRIPSCHSTSDWKGTNLILSSAIRVPEVIMKCDSQAIILATVWTHTYSNHLPHFLG